MEAGTKVVGLVRVSTDAQGDSGLGIEAQTETIRAECERRRWLLVDVIVETVSGRSAERVGLNTALDRIANGSASGIIVAKLDRLSRSVVDFGRILAWLDAADAHLVALDLGVDTSTPAGRLVANVLASVAEWEADTIADRTRVALQAKKARGEAVSLPSVPNAVAERIRALRADGLSYRAICGVLNDDGVPTARGATVWSVSAVQASLGYRRPKSKRSADLPPVPRRRAVAV